jgi:hypothetical protein
MTLKSALLSAKVGFVGVAAFSVSSCKVHSAGLCTVHILCFGHQWNVLLFTDLVVASLPFGATFFHAGIFRPFLRLFTSPSLASNDCINSFLDSCDLKCKNWRLPFLRSTGALINCIVLGDCMPHQLLG